MTSGGRMFKTRLRCWGPIYCESCGELNWWESGRKGKTRCVWCKSPIDTELDEAIFTAIALAHSLAQDPPAWELKEVSRDYPGASLGERLASPPPVGPLLGGPGGPTPGPGG